MSDVVKFLSIIAALIGLGVIGVWLYDFDTTLFWGTTLFIGGGVVLEACDR